MRGTPVRPSFRGPECRFIPAHAGNSAARSPPPGRCSVHPRACGELAARGRADHAESAVHPRACGELASCRRNIDLPFGSSPRMRGTLRGGLARRGEARFIPAHAGNSFPSGLPLWRSSVHPRACGELLGFTVDQLKNHRFIPAHAGNSITTTRLQRAGSVHPRACGELACAEKPGPGAIQVHPRACGELRSLPMRERSSTGSSPRMRGTLFLETHDSKRFARP